MPFSVAPLLVIKDDSLFGNMGVFAPGVIGTSNSSLSSDYTAAGYPAALISKSAALRGVKKYLCISDGVISISDYPDLTPHMVGDASGWLRDFAEMHQRVPLSYVRSFARYSLSDRHTIGLGGWTAAHESVYNTNLDADKTESMRLFAEAMFRFVGVPEEEFPFITYQERVNSNYLADLNDSRSRLPHGVGAVMFVVPRMHSAMSHTNGTTDLCAFYAVVNTTRSYWHGFNSCEFQYDQRRYDGATIRTYSQFWEAPNLTSEYAFIFRKFSGNMFVNGRIAELQNVEHQWSVAADEMRSSISVSSGSYLQLDDPDASPVVTNLPDSLDPFAFGNETVGFHTLGDSAYRTERFEHLYLKNLDIAVFEVSTIGWPEHCTSIVASGAMEIGVTVGGLDVLTIGSGFRSVRWRGTLIDEVFSDVLDDAAADPAERSALLDKSCTSMFLAANTTIPSGLISKIDLVRNGDATVNDLRSETLIPAQDGNPARTFGEIASSIEGRSVRMINIVTTGASYSGTEVDEVVVTQVGEEYTFTSYNDGIALSTNAFFALEAMENGALLRNESDIVDVRQFIIEGFNITQAYSGRVASDFDETFVWKGHWYPGRVTGEQWAAQCLMLFGQNRQQISQLSVNLVSLGKMAARAAAFGNLTIDSSSPLTGVRNTSYHDETNIKFKNGDILGSF